jgi:trigger factor
LRGASAGEQRTLEISFPSDYSNSELAGQAATFDVTVKEVKEKLLPELDDDFASDAAGFETLDELREDIRARLLAIDERRVEREYREAAIDAAADAAKLTVPDALIEARAQEAWERTLHSLAHQGVSKEAYLRIAGRSETQILTEARPDAERSLRREAVIAAIVAAERIEPTDEQLLEALAEGGNGGDGAGDERSPEKLLAALRKAGRVEELRDEVAARIAVDRLVAEAKPITPELAAAREKLWTPGDR